MFRFSQSIFLLVTILFLADCKSSQEKAITELRYNTQLESVVKLATVVNPNDLMKPAIQYYAESCARLVLLADTIKNFSCSDLNSFAAPSPQNQAAQPAAERDALAAYAEGSDRIVLLQSVLKEVELARRSLLSNTAVGHWSWSELLDLTIQRFYAAAKASVANGVPEDFPLAALSSDNRAALAEALEREHAILTTFGRPDDGALFEKTLASIAGWQERLRQSEAIAGQISALKAKIVELGQPSLGFVPRQGDRRDST